MKFNRPFLLQLVPNYWLLEEEPGEDVTPELVEEMGGISDINVEPKNEGEVKLYNGGRFDWGLLNDPERTLPPIVDVHLMRLWCTQVFTQLVNNKSYVNEGQSEPKINITDEEREVMISIITKLNTVLHDEMIYDLNALVRKEKIEKFKF